jgi:hypothetical protein
LLRKNKNKKIKPQQQLAKQNRKYRWATLALIILFSILLKFLENSQIQTHTTYTKLTTSKITTSSL